jgi:hypothetical protein
MSPAASAIVGVRNAPAVTAAARSMPIALPPGYERTVEINKVSDVI